MRPVSTDARATAAAYYRRAGRNAAEEMQALCRNPQGILYLSARLVALLKPVLSTEPQTWEVLESSPVQADAWYVHLLAGDLRLAQALARQLPPLRWLCFQRGLRHSRPHRCSWQRFCARGIRPHS